MRVQWSSRRVPFARLSFEYSSMKLCKRLCLPRWRGRHTYRATKLAGQYIPVLGSSRGDRPRIKYKIKYIFVPKSSYCYQDNVACHSIQWLMLANQRPYSHEAFVEDYAKRRVNLSLLQRGLLAAGSATISLTNPYRGDMIACLGETTGQGAMVHCRGRMLESAEGRRILEQKPRINSRTVDLEGLKLMPEGSVGKTYSDFLVANKVSPDDRPPVQFVDDLELAYVMQRYREVHDIFHAMLLMPTTMLGEVAVKWVEALQLKLPMCIGGAIFGAARLKPKQRQLYLKYHLPWAIQTGKNAKFLLGVYFEERWEQPLEDFHKEMNIKRLV